MKLQWNDVVNNRAAWEAKGYHLPAFDREAVAAKTAEAPEWVHFGAGNIFRAFVANTWQKVLEAGKGTTGIIAAEGFDYEIITSSYRPHDNLALAVTLKADGSIDKDVVASIVDSVIVDSENAEEWGKLLKIFEAPSLQMASFTITEKGYSLRNAKGEIAPLVADDFAAGPACPKSYIGKVASLLYHRFEVGALPISMVSMDNCSHNGTKLYDAVNAYAQAWEANGLVKAGFAAYVNDPAKVGFPWSMIDKITPRPDPGVKKMLEDDGFEDTESVVTSKKTYVAPFVNAEEAQYLVIQDWFPNGHPALEEGGIIFTDRETVDKIEKMKVCTCLNPLHTALAVYGCLLGYQKICDEMQDEDLVKLIHTIGYVEGLPVVVDPGIISPKAFIDEVLTKRFPNPFMPDTPQRIATDTSQKLAIRFGETIKAYLRDEDKDPASLNLIPLVQAGWCRYLLGIDDEGNAFELSPDPLLDDVRPYLANVKLGEVRDFHEDLAPILSDAKIFAVNLYEVGLGEKVEKYFAELVAGRGAVRETLKKYTA
ncbi:MAG: mannitol dehydrogenase family protein [Lachnospiraceae bacterium]|nr:mannitol dehydrogenase family protein [Lachnospiraceae bacterium]